MIIAKSGSVGVNAGRSSAVVSLVTAVVRTVNCRVSIVQTSSTAAACPTEPD
jgi:hypothetical protein